MKRIISSLFSVLVLMAYFSRVEAQCVNNNTLLSSFTPVCNGVAAVATNCIQGGQYVAVSVVAGNVYTFSTCGTTAFDSQITIYNSTGGGSLGYNDDGCGLQSTVTWTATFTGTLWVLVDQFSCTNNTTCIPLNVTCSAAPPPLSNDNPCNAIPLTVGTTCSYTAATTAGATPTTGVPVPGCASYTGSDVWFTAVVPASGSLTLDGQAGVITDGGMAVYTATACNGTFTLIECDDDDGTGLMPTLILNSLTPGSTVYIRFWEFGGDNNGSFGICAFDNNAPPPPPSTVCLSPLPDICASACDLGTLPAPIPCIAGQVSSPGQAATFGMTNVGSTAANPYSSIVGCANPAGDVWYRFRATGTELSFSLTSTTDVLNVPNVSLYNGSNCNALLPLQCFVGAGGNIPVTTYSPLTPGDYYYLQISGSDPTDVGNFDLLIKNNYICNTCLLASDLQVTPPPVNGTYNAGQTVNFCFTVSNYNQTAANWLHGIDLNFGPGWDLTTLGPVSSPNSCAINAGANWGFYNSVTGGFTGTVYGPGFFYETASGGPALDANPGNNFGDQGVGLTCPLTFCWRIATDPLAACIDGSSLNVAINTLGDYESGSWGSVGCQNDPIVNFNAALSCCPQALIASTPSTCGGATGTATATGQGLNPPFDYTWADASGTILSTVNNVNGPNTISNLAAGQYFVTVVDNNNCTSNQTATITSSGGATVTVGNTGPYCLGSTISLSSSATGALSYSWSGPNSFTSAAQNPTIANSTLAMSGLYYVTATFTGGCTATGSTNVVVNALPVAAISPATVAICNGTSATLTASGGATYAWSNAANNAAIAISPTSTTTYSVTVTDANTCTATASRIVTVNPLPVAVINPATVAICNGTSSTLTASGGTSFSWSNAANTATITVSPTSTTTYSVTVTDANTCTATASRIVTVNPLPVAVINPASVAICNGTSVTLTASGGTSFAWSNAANTAAITVSPTSTTTYSVTVTDANTCTATTSATVTVNPLPVAVINPTTVAICNGTSATLTASGGTSYVWSNAANTSAITVSPTSTTTYSVTVTDANTCTATTSSTVTVNPLPVAVINPATVAICNGTSTTLTASGGNSYVWSNAANTAAITVSPTSTTTYSVTVTDANTCTATTSATVTVNPLPVAVINPATVAICNGTSTTLTASGGTSFAWSNAANTAAITVSPTSTTTYSVTVTDANTCTATTSATVTVNPLPVAVINPATVAICNGTSATLTASGGNSYVWSNAANTAAITVSPTATTTYSVTVTDLNTCTATTSATVTVNPLPVAVINPATVAICNGTSATLTASGGTSYVWSNAANTAAITISPNSTTTYSVTVTDTNTCTATTSATVTVNPLPVAVINPAAVAICNGTSTTLTASGGTSFAWSNAASTAAITVSPTSTTTYSVTVTDANTCTATTSSTVTVNPLPVAVINPATVAICNGTSATLTASGGTSFAWSNAANTAAITVSPTSTTTYSVTVTDANTCTATVSRTVSVIPTMIVSASTANVSCNGGVNGSINLSVSSGQPAYSFSWSNSAITQNITNLTAGQYTVTVTDNAACTASASATITQPTSLNVVESHVDVTCNAQSTGSINVTSSGGTTPYTFAWNDAVTTEDRNGITAGTYTITVTDNNSCSASVSAVISEPSALVVSETHADVPCSGGNTGSIDLTVSGASLPYTYLWNDGNTTQDRVNLSLGNYLVTITDNNSCSASLGVTIISNSGLSITETHQTVSCYGGNNGSIDINVNGGLPPYSYAWNDAVITEDRNNISAGNYSVSATDGNGCIISTAVTITEPSVLMVTETHSPVLCNGGNSGAIDLTVSGASTPYTFVWNDAITTEDRNNLTSGNYSVTVNDINFCSSSLSVNISEPAILSISETHTDVSCFGTNTGTIDITTAGGTSPYSFTWNDGIFTEDRNNLTAGSYNIVVSDNNTCTSTLSVSILQPSAVSLSETHINTKCFGSSDASIDISTSGGTVPYSFVWNDLTATEDRNNIAAGVYSITANDAFNCSASLTVNISQPVLLALTETHQNPSCYTYSDGTAWISVTGGTPSYSYLWNDGNTSATRNGLIAGIYTVTVSDNNLCTISTAIDIVDPSGMNLTSSFVNPTCETNGNDGSITLNVSGGTTPYNYNWSGSSPVFNLNQLGPGDYQVTVSDANNCSLSSSFTLNYQFDFSIDATNAVTINFGDNTTLGYTLTGNAGNYINVWSPPASLSCSDCTSPVAWPVTSTLYQIQISNDAGCIAADTVSVYVVPNYDIFIPNVFTPNGDGNNDLFNIFGNLKMIAYLDIQIFNRWGEKVFESNDHNFTWDGTFKGEMQNPQVFTWQLKITFLDGYKEELRKGTLTLVR